MNADAVKQYFDDQIATAQKARKMYQDGAAERTGIQRESYLAYSDAQATRETFLREVSASLLMLIVADNAGKDRLCGRCGHAALYHANFGIGECQISIGCGSACHEFAAHSEGL